MLGDTKSLETDFEDGSNYKSCYARSVVVNSQYQQLKILQNQPQLLKGDNNNIGKVPADGYNGNSIIIIKPTPPTSLPVKLRRDSCLTDSRRNSVVSDSRRSSACSSRIAEMPIENLVLKSQIETLEWQLKQTEANREMYRALMKQIVKFLGKAHHNLQILGTKLNTKSNQSVPKSQLEYCHLKEESLDGTLPSSFGDQTDYMTFRDFTWRRHKRSNSILEEVPVEKLSQEAFRLLRTAESLLNTHAPDLAHINNDTSEELRFLEQLAKEFPRSPENGTHKPNSECSRLQALTPDEDVRISTTLNRKLSLQRSNTEFKRNSFHTSSPKHNNLSNDFTGSDCGSSSIYSYKLSRNKSEAKGREFKFEQENSTSPPVSGSMSSAEDESGFSSMNSFQEIGIPLVYPNSTNEEKTTKDAILKSMLHDDCDINVAEDSSTVSIMEEKVLQPDIKLWEKPLGVTGTHKRWNSSPVQKKVPDKPGLKVLWV